MSWMVPAGAISAFLSVAAGAFGAHGLKARVPAELLAHWETGARYQMYHALALVLLGSWAQARPSSLATPAGLCFLAGTLFFSGSLYVLAFTGVRWLGAITPIGGVAFLAGWVLFAVAALRPAG